MSDIAIRVEGVGKHYRLGAGGDADSMREAITMAAGRFARRLIGRGEPPRPKREFWALDNVSFEVKKGDVVGIVGHNGAGKSTLLKILSRITDPTTGRVDIWGRLGSLLEVGTGFHPELTGRENIFLNGAILGMTFQEIKSKFDEIVAFSELEDFLDTPVKRYSSGMYVRLAFSVAAHLQPEILIVDEVLAVGDMKFQNKCMGKMKDVATQGRTVLFVSHNMGAVSSMCTRGLVLDHGRVHSVCTANEAVVAYLELMNEKAKGELSERTDREGDGKVRVVAIQVTTESGKPPNTVATGERVRFEVTVDRPVAEMNCLLMLADNHGQRIIGLRNNPEGDDDRVDPSLGNKLVCVVDDFPLASGQYRIDCELWSQNNHQHDSIKAASLLTVVGGTVRGRLVRQPIRHAPVVPPHQWTLPL